jgi:hypothetical protein
VSLIKVRVRRGKTTITCILDGEAGSCFRCRRPILWALTPRGKRMLVDPPAAGANHAECHFGTCAARRKEKTA